MSNSATKVKSKVSSQLCEEKNVNKLNITYREGVDAVLPEG